MSKIFSKPTLALTGAIVLAALIGLHYRPKPEAAAPTLEEMRDAVMNYPGVHLTAHMRVHAGPTLDQILGTRGVEAELTAQHDKDAAAEKAALGPKLEKLGLDIANLKSRVDQSPDLALLKKYLEATTVVYKDEASYQEEHRSGHRDDVKAAALKAIATRFVEHYRNAVLAKSELDYTAYVSSTDGLLKGGIRDYELVLIRLRTITENHDQADGIAKPISDWVRGDASFNAEYSALFVHARRTEGTVISGAKQEQENLMQAVVYLQTLN